MASAMPLLREALCRNAVAFQCLETFIPNIGKLPTVRDLQIELLNTDRLSLFFWTNNGLFLNIFGITR